VERFRRAFTWLLVAAGLGPAGCFAGYEVVHYKNALGDVQTVAIEAIANRSFEPGADAIVSDAITSEFLRRGSLRLVDDKSAADLVIGGIVEAVEVQSRSFSSIQFALEYSVMVRLKLDVRRRDGSEVKLDDRTMQESDLYFASADVEVMRKNREEAVRRVASVLAGRLHDGLFERVVP
jgi:ribosomal protein L14